MEQITLRLPEDVLDAVEQEADEQGISRAEYLREVIRSRNESDADVSDLKAKVSELEKDLKAERSEADRLSGKLEVKNETIEAKNEHIEAKNDHIESLESTIYEQQQAMNNAVAQRGVFGRIRSALGSGDDEQD